MANVIQKPHAPRGDEQAVRSYEHIEVRAITPHTGAEVGGVQLADLSAAALAEIKTAFTEHLVLVFREQMLTPQQHKDFGREFGQLHIHPTFSHLGKKGDPELFIIDTTPTSKFSNGETWHTDVSCDPRPPLASLLYIEQPPPDGGGDTLFGNMYEAFAALSAPMQELLLPLRAVHDGRKDLDAYGYRLPADRDYPRAEHPVITRHPESNRPVLFVNGSFTTHIAGLTRRESDALLALLVAHIADNPRWQCRVRWSANTLVMWDNRCAQHHAVWDYYPHNRHARRVTVQCATPPEPYRP